MPLSDIPCVFEIKDPIHGYIGLCDFEVDILDLRLTQRLRYIKALAGVHLVYPGSDTSLLGSMLGVKHVTQAFIEHMGGDIEEVMKARLAAMLLLIAKGAWSNVMDEYLSVRGVSRKKLAEILTRETEIRDIIERSEFSLSETIDLIRKGIPLKGVNIDLLRTPVNPELIDCLMRDSYFAGVDYAKMEYRRLFDVARIVKNRIAVERGALFTLDSYLTAAVTMSGAVYYHKTVRAAELMLIRILDMVGSQVSPDPTKDLKAFSVFDDFSFYDILPEVEPTASDEMKTASKIFNAYKNRYLLKLASERAIGDEVFLNQLSRPDGIYKIETEIAEAADIDPMKVYVDYPFRHSVYYYPGKLSIDELSLFERGSRGYEFWPLTDHSLLARSFKRALQPVRVYTTRGYRTRVRKEADRFLECIEDPTRGY